MRGLRTLKICAVALAFAAMATSAFYAQTPAPQVPQWQIDAGSSAKFDVASVKEVPSGARPQGDNNVFLTGDDNFTPTGGLFSVKAQLATLILFAYKLRAYGYYSLGMAFGGGPSPLPKWALTTPYDIEARAPGNPTKDKYRLMMQSLLAERFKLAVHWEMKQVRVMAVVLEKPGKLGPGIRPHSDDVACPAGWPPSGPQKTIAGGFPEFCGEWYWSDSGLRHRAARNVPVSAMTDYFMNGPTERSYVDKTGLKGNYDIALEWSPQPGDFDYRPDANGPTFVEALKNQLGFKLIPEVDPVETLIIDYVEEPSPN